MKEITRNKKLEVALYYLLGYTYKEIEAETGVSHGSIANIVSEIGSGDLVIPGTPFEQVNDLRQLSSDLARSGLKPSQALFGITFLKKLQALQIKPEHLEAWSELVNRLLPPDFPVNEFFESARRLHDLETSQGKSFETITEEYKNNRETLDRIKGDIDSLREAKLKLSNEIKPLSRQVEDLRLQKGRLTNDIQTRTTKLQEIKKVLKEVEEEKTALRGDIKDLQRKKVKLSAEVEGKEESLHKLNELDFSDEDLLRLRSFLERTGKNENIGNIQVKERFFSVLGLYKDAKGIESEKEAEVMTLRKLVREKAKLTSEIKELEKRKGTSLGQLDKSVIAASSNIRNIAGEAVIQIREQSAQIKSEFESLLLDAINTGVVVSKMQQMVKKGEESEVSLKRYMEDVRERLEVR